MKTVDVLLATIALFSDRSNWTSSSLNDRKSITTSDGKTEQLKDEFCFCALGGILWSGGVYQEGEKFANGYKCLTVKPSLEVDPCGGLSGLTVGDRFYHRDSLGLLPQAIIRTYAAMGAHVIATAKAQAYLQEAVNRLAGRRTNIYSANDGGADVNGVRVGGYDFIMMALNLAARNAKRRHIKGDRSKTNRRSVTVRAVAQ